MTGTGYGNWDNHCTGSRKEKDLKDLGVRNRKNNVPGGEKRTDDLMKATENLENRKSAVLRRM